MFKVETVTNSIADRISLELGLDDDRKEVIAYGIFALIHTVLSIVLVILFGVLFGVWVEALIVSLVTSILRKYSGGVHASSPGICAIVGTVISVGQAIMVSFCIIRFVNLFAVILIGILTFIYSYYLIYKLAPVDSAAKPIKTQKKRKRMKKVSILILSVYMLIVVFNIIMYIITNQEIFFTIVLCIYGGIIWQVFTLTKEGHLILRKIDAFFYHILNYKGRRK